MKRPRSIPALWCWFHSSCVAITLSLVATGAHAGVGLWTSAGPPRNVSALAIDPGTPTTLYAGTDVGVFKSTTGGDSWTAVNEGLTNSFVLALAIDPITPTTLYAGTYGGSSRPRLGVAAGRR
jgi:hypothetical protein